MASGRIANYYKPSTDPAHGGGNAKISACAQALYPLKKRMKKKLFFIINRHLIVIKSTFYAIFVI